jgi:hypothetical protein
MFELAQRFRAKLNPLFRTPLQLFIRGRLKTAVNPT